MNLVTCSMQHQTHRAFSALLLIQLFAALHPSNRQLSQGNAKPSIAAEQIAGITELRTKYSTSLHIHLLVVLP